MCEQELLWALVHLMSISIVNRSIWLQ